MNSHATDANSLNQESDVVDVDAVEVNVTASNAIGVDIGGANIKLAAADGRSASIAFPMWLDYDRLDQALRGMLDAFIPSSPASGSTLHACSTLAVTMTGELADCFETRRAGVEHILTHVQRAVDTRMDIRVYSVAGGSLTGGFLTVDEARQQPWNVAASNWHALAKWLCESGVLGERRAAVQRAILVDIGSTTVDVIPLLEGRIAADAQTDRQRLERWQLVYTGMQRTPVAAIVQSLKFRGADCPVMAERFATSDDAYLALQLVPSEETEFDTADGRPRTTTYARARLARMIGEDQESATAEEIDCLAQQVIDAQARQVAAAVVTNQQQLENASMRASIIVTGHGRPLAERVLMRLASLDAAGNAVSEFDCIWLDELQSTESARCAPAQAVAWLWQNRVTE